ncbi:FAD/NAD(P)-binding domain-containing protein [Colletotrichum caudatum]|nr:FAD/NAD(P)-binding domain-containing protein [Colletotrichum caudatum]
MKVIIVGAGVAGLSAYLQLKKLLPKSTLEKIQIYESHRGRQPVTGEADQDRVPETEPAALTDSATVVGNVIALTPTTLRLLRYIDEDLYDLFQSRGYRNETYRFRTARGHSLATTATDDGRSPREYTVSCPRAMLRDCLLEIVGEDNVQYRRVVAVHLNNGTRPVVRFADGREESADLVLGADGVRSVVKKAIFEPAGDATLLSPHYEGFCGVGGFLPMRDLPASVRDDKSVVFTFGPTGSFGYCSAAPEEQGILGWWSNWGRPDIPQNNVMEPDEIRQQLRSRHGAWRDPVIQHVLEHSSTNRVYPIWTTADLPFWSAHGAVLLGDAAHTLPATSGQGAGQALGDSVVFCLLLASYLDHRPATESTGADFESRAVQLAAKGLYDIQAPRVAAIKRRSRNLYLTDKKIENVFLEYIYYLYLSALIRIPILARLILGTVFSPPDEADLEEQVKRYLDKADRGD